MTVKNGASPEEIAAKYADKNEDELMRELLSAVSAQKKDGSFDAAEMRKTANMLLPMLNAKQAKKLMGIISAIEQG